MAEAQKHLTTAVGSGRRYRAPSLLCRKRVDDALYTFCGMYHGDHCRMLGIYMMNDRTEKPVSARPAGRDDVRARSGRGRRPCDHVCVARVVVDVVVQACVRMLRFGESEGLLRWRHALGHHEHFSFDVEHTAVSRRTQSKRDARTTQGVFACVIIITNSCRFFKIPSWKIS